MLSRFCLCILICLLSCVLSINVKLAPSSHPRIYNRSAPCPLPCHFSVQFQTADAELYIARGDECVREALNTHSSSPFRILGSHESSDYHHLLRVEFLNFHFDGSATLDRGLMSRGCWQGTLTPTRKWNQTLAPSQLLSSLPETAIHSQKGVYTWQPSAGQCT